MAAPNALPDYDDGDMPTALFPAHGHFAAPAVPRVEPAAVALAPAAPLDEAVPPAEAPAPPRSSDGQAPPSRPRSVSFIRIKVDVADEATRQAMVSLAAHHVRLADSIAWVEGRLAELPRDPSTRAAGASVAARLAEASAVRDAMSELNRAVAENAAALLAPGAPLQRLLEAVHGYLWTALFHLAALVEGLRVLEADWGQFRAGLSVAEAWMPFALEDEARAHLAEIDLAQARTGETVEVFDELVFALRLFATNVGHPFG